MSLPRYSKYKDSGVEWVGEVPEHWRCVRNKAVFREVDDRSENEDGELLTVSHITGVTPRSEKTVNMFLAETLEGYKRCKRGDLVINTMWAWMGALGCSPCDGLISPSYNVYRPREGAELLPAYYDHLCRIPSHRVSMKARSSGVWESRLRLYPAAFLDMSLTLPPLVEQVAISAFLDRETAKIDALVAEQQRLIELLKEKRQAVISHALTKGLNPKVPMKDSSVDWLGEIPAHWDVATCGRYTSILSGFAFPSTGFVEDSSEIRLLRGINVGVGKLRWDEVVYWRRSIEDGLDAYELRAGDLVIGMDRPLIADGMRVARVAAEDVPCLLLQRVAMIRTREELLLDFLASLLSSPMFVAHFEPDVTGVSVPHISPEQIRTFRIPVPPPVEQVGIVNHINETSARFDTLVAEAQQAIELLQERRTALISAAVTGQIDVRNASGKTA